MNLAILKSFLACATLLCLPGSVGSCRAADRSVERCVGLQVGWLEQSKLVIHQLIEKGEDGRSARFTPALIEIDLASAAKLKYRYAMDLSEGDRALLLPLRWSLAYGSAWWASPEFLIDYSSGGALQQLVKHPYLYFYRLSRQDYRYETNSDPSLTKRSLDSRVDWDEIDQSKLPLATFENENDDRSWKHHIVAQGHLYRQASQNAYPEADIVDHGPVQIETRKKVNYDFVPTGKRSIRLFLLRQRECLNVDTAGTSSHGLLVYDYRFEPALYDDQIIWYGRWKQVAAYEATMTEPFHMIWNEVQPFLLTDSGLLFSLPFAAAKAKSSVIQQRLRDGETIHTLIRQGSKAFAFTQNYWFEVGPKIEYRSFQSEPSGKADAFAATTRCAREIMLQD